MEKFIIPIHSFIDVITNSSTEIFMLDSQELLTTVEKIVKDKEKEFPPDSDLCGGCYNRHVSVEEAQRWDIDAAFGNYDEEDVVKYLRALGYTVEKNENPQKYIMISCERGYMNQGLRNFINQTFNVVYHTTDG